MKLIGSVTGVGRDRTVEYYHSLFGTSWSVLSLAFLIFFQTGCIATFSTEHPIDEDDGGSYFNDVDDVDTGSEPDFSEETETAMLYDTASEEQIDTETSAAVPSDEGDTDTLEEVDTDLCPDDTDKTEPGECGCGVAEGACPVECPSGIGRLDNGQHLCWQHPKSTDTFTWNQAVQYCDTSTLGGHSDWRLPSRQNYLDLLGNCDGEVLSGNSGYCNPCAMSDTCNSMFFSDGQWYWTGTKYDFDSRWRVNFETGKVGKVKEGFTNYVRCVRETE